MKQKLKYKPEQSYAIYNVLCVVIVHNIKLLIMYYDTDWKQGDEMNEKVILSILQSMYEQQLNANIGGIIGSELEREQAETDLRKFEQAVDWFSKKCIKKS